MTDRRLYTEVTKRGHAWVGPDTPAGRYEVTAGADGAVILVPAPRTGPPYRFVDREQRGWMSTDNDMARVYPALPGAGYVDSEWPYERVVAERGPTRPVEAPDDDDERTLRLALARARTKAVGSLLVVLNRLARECQGRDGHTHRLVAGRPGSWESELLKSLAWDGDGFPASRIDEQAVVDVMGVLHGWIFAPDRYVEVAENLAAIFGRVIDGRGGWDQVTDVGLRRDQRGARAYRLLAYTSTDFDPA